MAQTRKRKTGTNAKAAAVQLAARRLRDELRRTIARETEIARLTKGLANAQLRAADAVEQLRVNLNNQASADFARAATMDAHRRELQDTR